MAHADTHIIIADYIISCRIAISPCARVTMKEKVRDLGIEEDDPLQTTMRTLTMHLDLVSYHMKDVFGEIFHSNDMSYMHER